MDFDTDRIYFSHQNLASSTTNSNEAANVFDITDNSTTANSTTASLTAVRRHLREFLRNYRIGANRYPYRNALLNAYRRYCQQTNNDSGSHVDVPSDGGMSVYASVEVELCHVSEYDTALLGLLLQKPAQTLPVFEAAAGDCLRSLLYRSNGGGSQEEDNGGEEEGEDGGTVAGNGGNGDGNGNAEMERTLHEMGSIQILLSGSASSSSVGSSISSSLQHTSLRCIASSHVNRLLLCPGIVISANRVKSRAHTVRIRCGRCADSRTLRTQAFGRCVLPTKCHGPDPEECKLNPYEIVPDECKYVDQQQWKLQEAPECVPTGEMPRTILVSADRALVDAAPPGTRVHVMGIACVNDVYGTNNKKSAGLRQVYLRAVGMSKAYNQGGSSTLASFTPAEEEAFRELARRPDIYELLSHSIAPSISGSYTVDIKKALACQLMGGSAKRLPDKMRLRGDVNVLLMGDPSTAKSQFLKFIEKVAPIGVYTSGKGSSAAGLTASVVRDRNNEFYLEGGAMVLADGGIVCIDEFDKMRPQDRVAIHEAMEQQTISVAKAGITTVLNSRCSVLAAANPVFGRYDDLKSATENIDLMTTILSRFDLIFIVRDVREEERDKAICRHVMGVHMGSNSYGNGRGSTGRTSSLRRSVQAGGGDQDYSKADGNGSVAQQAMRLARASRNNNSNDNDIPEFDVPTMKKFVQYCRAKCSPRLSEEASDVLTSAYVKIRDDVRKRSEGAAQAVPITVRQLEALVRISESLAKMRLSAEVSADDITEALRLFRVSTMAASAADKSLSLQTTLSGAGSEEIRRLENFIKSRVTIGATVNKQRIVEEASSQGYDPFAMMKAIAVMTLRGELQEKNQGHLMKRLI